MVDRFAFLFIVALLFNGCCTKKACLGEEMPVIEFNFADTASLEGSRVVVKTRLNNTIVDSLVITNNFDQHFILSPFQFHGDDEGRLKSYEVHMKGKTTVIDNITIDFNKQEFKCNECFPVRVEKEFILVNDNFSFRHQGQTFLEGSLLTLD